MRASRNGLVSASNACASLRKLRPTPYRRVVDRLSSFHRRAGFLGNRVAMFSDLNPASTHSTPKNVEMSAPKSNSTQRSAQRKNRATILPLSSWHVATPSTYARCLRVKAATHVANNRLRDKSLRCPIRRTQPLIGAVLEGRSRSCI